MGPIENAKDPSLTALVKALSGTDVEFAHERRAYFRADAAMVEATVDDMTSRVLVSAFFDPDNERIVEEWVSRQPQPVSGKLAWAIVDQDQDQDDGTTEHWPLLTFERPPLLDWSLDPIADEIRTYAKAWETGDVTELAESARGWTVTDDPRDVTPESAWLLFASDESYPNINDLEHQERAARVGMFTGEWTAASTTRCGDLLLVYFIKPRKAVHFIARAASDAFFRRDDDPHGQAGFSPTQWWVNITPLVEIEPITFERLLDGAGAGLVMRSRSGIFLDPRAITKLDFRAKDSARQPQVDVVAVTPTGLADLPSPDAMTFDEWRDIASGAFKLEAHVSSHLVEPLLNSLLSGQGMTFAREYRIGKRVADFVILDREGRPIHVIEVKKRIRSAHGQRWEETPDFAQVRWYADQLGVAATLIDTQRVMLIDHLGGEPTRILTRRTLTSGDLGLIHDHIVRDGSAANEGTQTLWA